MGSGDTDAPPQTDPSTPRPALRKNSTATPTAL
jgi:hypothetical protein